MTGSLRGASAIKKSWTISGSHKTTSLMLLRLKLDDEDVLIDELIIVYFPSPVYTQ